MPSTLAPDRLSASSRRALSREARPPWVGEVTLSQELRTARLPRPHVLVGYQWSHTGLRPGRKTSHNRYIRSFVSHPPTDPGLHINAPGSSSHEFATRAIRRRYVDMVQVAMYLACFPSTAHETAPPVGWGTGACILGSGGNSTHFKVGLSPAPMATFPAAPPATGPPEGWAAVGFVSPASFNRGVWARLLRVLGP